jgi:hypothetical protein
MRLATGVRACVMVMMMMMVIVIVMVMVMVMVMLMVIVRVRQSCGVLLSCFSAMLFLLMFCCDV